MDDTNPTVRALRCLEALADSPGIGAARLAERLGCSERAARRYVAILRQAGMPVDSVRGPYGGYRLGRGVRLPPLLFSTAEALGLVMAVLDGHHDPTDDADPVAGALAKLLRALPAPVAKQAEAVRRATAPAPDRAAARPDPGTATSLVQASADRRRVRLGYRTEAGSSWSVEVDPWAVVVRHGRWYLLCFSHRAGAPRAYRVDRVTEVSVLEAAFEPPADLDAVADLEAHLAVGWEHEVEVRIAASRGLVVRRLPPTLGRLVADGEDACVLSGSTSNPGWYAEQLATCPASFHVVGCTHVREAAVRLGERLVAAGG